ncbi:exodeoxyribonuclease VII large subunit [Xenophilus arseniciresistens]|uniref:Exodeoxyribonuclease 7 large subunit n=1 Tax=Xenophilus arseniciresistens TaxID=1283306 RepID=A0AAE3N8A5_9BURK|nr:exodeoxyribonuclease VII large subunit [Xenophilus arseniciresistens]MDA7415109.1 exodeoxyribonuclease VII large subunit [Xenophilus arseniciresistens]
MNTPLSGQAPASRVWAVGALCRAVADALEARFNPVSVQGEISGFMRAASGHCYFTLKDDAGQLRCAMFRRAAQLLDFAPQGGDRVELRGRLGVYEPRGELQLVVESLRRAGQGSLFEQFLLRKAKLEAEGLFDAARKRPLPALPLRIGLVTSPGAAALHDVVTALRRRVPHLPVVLAPALVQGAQAPAELIAALQSLYTLQPAVDVILLVRGGGSIEDLWAFNDEALARTIVRSPVPVVVGVGHETDFSIADFCADLRAPTPTAAAELVAAPREQHLALLEQLQRRLRDALVAQIDQRGQRLDRVAARLGRPSALAARQQLALQQRAQRLRHGLRIALQAAQDRHAERQQALPRALAGHVQRQAQQLERLALRLGLLDPAVVLQRGYAWLTDASGQALTRVAQLQPGAAIHATLADGQARMTVDEVGSGPGPTRTRANRS